MLCNAYFGVLANASCLRGKPRVFVYVKKTEQTAKRGFLESSPKKDIVFQLFAAVDSLTLTNPHPQMVFTLQFITPFISLSSLVSTLPLCLFMPSTQSQTKIKLRKCLSAAYEYASYN